MSQTPPPVASVFPGRSDLAAMMRRHDWAATPLGDPAAWPQALHTVVRVLLTSRFAMWMGWGPELTFFYNDAYASMTLGAKHPWALGRPARDVWAEIWPQIGPRIDHVLRTGEATWDEALLLFLERSGYPEETYHTFSYSPLADDDGVVRGHLCVVTEETERVIGARRLGVLRDVAAEVAGADTEATLWSETARVLGARPHDTPFTLTYLFGADGAARLVCRSGAAGGGDGGDDGRLPWPAADARLGRPELVALDARFASGPTGPWVTRPTHALLLPIAAQDQGQPAGIFAVALNPYRALDDAYTGFLNLLVAQIAAGLAKTRALDAERRRAAALAEIDRAKTTFFSNVSHEFRTPLTLLLGPLEDALRDGRSLAGPDLEAGHRNALRLLKLVNALLDFARIEAGRAEARFEPVDLAAVTAELASVFRSAIERAGLTYTVRCTAPPQPVFVDRDMWEKVVLNLISNALKFTFDGGIRVTLTPTADGAELAVEDSGTGIAPEHLPRLFERFHRIEGGRARTHEGSGIGLALVQELVHMHGGRIDVESAVGRGSRFVVGMKAGAAHLPAEHLGRRPATDTMGTAQSFVEEALRWLPSPPAAAEPPPIGPGAHRIVVADDNADMREYVARLLGDRWRVEAVANGREALAALAREPADLVVTDVMMPELDGFGLLRAMRADAALAAVPVLMLSARSGEEARIEGLDGGADDYLSKPFSARELVARVGNHLELAAARREAAAERDRLRGLLGHVPAVVNFLRGPDLVFDFAHPLAVAAAGGRPLQGRPFLEALPELRDQPLYEQLRRAYVTGEPVSGHEVPARLENTGGTFEERFWTFLYLPIRSASGVVEGVMTFDLDVTEQVRGRQQLEAQAEALAAAREAAEVASRAKDEFLAILGHELRNPLAPILTALEVLRLRGVRSREQEIIQRQVTHLTRLVDDLLDVSRVTRGTIELRRERLELGDAVFRACELAAPLLDERRHVLDIDVPPGLVVDADPDRLSQVVLNLLANAAKYSDPGSAIAILGARRDGVIELRIADEGIGIPPEMLARIFQPFVQQPQTIERSRGGLGLGLTIVKTLVEKHGGSVAVSSAGPWQGSEFVITLPAAGDPAPAPEPVAAPAAARPATRGQHVLVVDDNADALEMLSAVLRALGYAVEAAPDGRTALAMATRRFPDIALLDVGLPEMDGYELARRLRAEAPPGSPLRLIAVTGYGQGADAARAAAAGFEAHLVKPVDVAGLQQALDRRP